MDESTPSAEGPGPGSFTFRLRDAWEELKVREPSRKATQNELARFCDVSQGTVSAWFSGETKVVSGPPLVRLAQFLRVSIAWLVAGEGDRFEGAPLNTPTLELALETVCAALARQTPARRESIALLLHEMTKDPGQKWVVPLKLLLEPGPWGNF